MTDYPEASYPILSRRRFRPSIRGNAVRDDVDGPLASAAGRVRAGQRGLSPLGRRVPRRLAAPLTAYAQADPPDSGIGAYAQARRGRPTRKRRPTGIY